MTPEHDPVSAGVARNVTAQGEETEALRRERDLFSAVLETAGALVVVLDRQGRIVRFNCACERATGYSFEEVKGQTLWDLFLVPEEVAPVRAVFEQLRAGHFPNQHENHWLTKDGTRRLIAWSNTALLGADDSVEYVIGTGIDITERKQAEAQRDVTLEALCQARDELEARVAERTAELERANRMLEEEVVERTSAEETLRETEGHLRSLMESAQRYAIFRLAVDPAHPHGLRIVLASPSLKELLGVSELTDISTWIANIHPDDVERTNKASARSIETGTLFDEQYRVFRPARGEWDWVHNRSIPVFDSTGRLTHFNGLMVDITEQKRVEDALRQSELRFRAVFEGAPIGISVTSLGPQLLETNRALQEMFGYTGEEFYNLAVSEFSHPEDMAVDAALFDELVLGKRDGYQMEKRFIRKNGEMFWGRLSLSLVRGEQGEPLFAIATTEEISERKKAEQALEEAYQTLEQRVDERTRELTTLLEVSKKLVSTLEIEPLLGSILDELRSVVDYEGCMVFTLEGDELVARAHRSRTPQDRAMSLRWRVDDPLDRLVLTSREPVLVSDTRGNSREAQAYRESAGELQDTLYPHIRSWLGVPLIAKGQVIGELALDHSRPEFFTPGHARFAMAFANQAAVAIENARLYKQAEQAAAMEERGRLARELHDSVTQSLYSVTMYTEAAARLLPPGLEAAAEHLRDARDTAQEALREMRLMIYQLRPPVLEKGGLAVALQVRLDAVERRGGMRADLIVEGEDRLPPAVQAELHQIAQEALNNALKHARARQVKVHLEFGDAVTRLAVQDDGVGFDPASAQAGGGLGLPGMRERAQKIGGRLEIESAPSRGTRIMVEVRIGGKE